MHTKACFVALRRVFLVLLSLTIVGYLLLVAVYCLPTDRMTYHVEESLQQLNREGQYPALFYRHRTTTVDNHTDAYMLAESIYDGDESSFIKAAAVYKEYLVPGVRRPLEDLNLTIQGQEDMTVQGYPKYWHGYLLVVKPLLLFFNIVEIRYLNMFFQLLLLFFTLRSLRTAGGYSRYQLPLLVAVVFLTPFTLWFCMQYSVVYYLSLGAVNAVLYFGDRLEKRGWMLLFFLVVGALTSYFDYLTYPLLTLGLPLCIYTVMLSRQQKSGKALLWRFVGCVAYWGIGYVGFWAIKWVLGTLILQENVIADALTRVAQRASLDESINGETPETLLGVWQHVVQIYGTSAHALMLLLPTGGYLVDAVGKLRKHECVPVGRSGLPTIAALVMLMCSPFVWFALTLGHTSNCSFFTHRALVVLVFAWLTLMAWLGDPLRGGANITATKA